MQIKPKDIALFNKQGWVALSMELSEKEIHHAQIALIEMRKKFINTQFPLGRTYFDHIYTKNPAAIEAPFHQNISNIEIESCLHKLSLGSAVKELMRWEGTYCSLARIFIMGNFKNRSLWHRDFPLKIANTKCGSSVSRQGRKTTFSLKRRI